MVVRGLPKVKGGQEYLAQFIKFLQLKYNNNERRYKPYIAVAKDFLSFLGRNNGDSSNATTINLATTSSYIHYLIYERGLKPSSAVTTANRLKVFLRFLGHNQVADQLPLPSQTPGVGDVDEEEPVIFLPEETIDYIIKNGALDYFDLTLIQMMYFFALRKGEAILLRRSWIDHNEKSLKIYRLKTKYPWQRLPFTEPHTTIQDTYGVLLYYLNEYKADSNSGDAPIFLLPTKGLRRDNLTPVSSRTIDYRVRRVFEYLVRNPNTPVKHRTLIEKVLVQDRNIMTHIFRHSRATNMILNMIEEKKPVSLYLVQQWLGHKMQQHTSRYVHIAAKYLGTEPERLEVIV